MNAYPLDTTIITMLYGLSTDTEVKETVATISEICQNLLNKVLVEFLQLKGYSLDQISNYFSVQPEEEPIITALLLSDDFAKMQADALAKFIEGIYNSQVPLMNDIQREVLEDYIEAMNEVSNDIAKQLLIEYQSNTNKLGV